MEPKARLVGETVSVVVRAAPVPVTVTDCVPVASTTLRVALREPVAAPLRKVMVPVGVPVDLVTVAVRVKDSPEPAERFEEESVVVVVRGGGTVPVPVSATV